MTTPNQTSPDGAITIGGGEWKYGQTINEATARATFEFPMPNPGNMIDLLRMALERLPLDALQPFADFLGFVDGVFTSVTEAVGAIIDSLLVRPALMLLDQFQEWTDNVFGPFFSSFGQLLQDLWNDPVKVLGAIPQALVNGLTGALNLITTSINQFGDIVNGLIVVPITSAVQNFFNWFRNLLGWQDNTVTTQTNLGNFQIAALAGNGPKQPVWVCRYPVGDVSYPEFLNTVFGVWGNTGAASTGTAHTHSLSGSVADAYPSFWTCGVGASAGGLVTISNSTVFDTAGMILYKQNVALNNVFMEVFRERQDGVFERIESVDISSQLTTVDKYIEVPISETVVQAGERYMVRVRNSSTVAGIVNVKGAEAGVGSVYAGWATNTAAISNKTSYTAAEMTTQTSAVCRWALLAGKNVTETDQSFTDDFNRSGLGSLWSLSSNTGTFQVAISNNKVVWTGGLITTGDQQGIFVRPTSSDAQRVDATLAPDFTPARGGLLMHCSRKGEQVVYLGVNGSSCKIFSGPWTNLVERASANVGGNGRWSMYYEPGTNTYTVLKEGVSVLTWQDINNFVVHGKDYRYGGLRHRRQIDNVIFYNQSGPIDNWTLRDWAPAPPPAA